MLKILHVSEAGINDPRIIKAAITCKRYGYDVYFAGAKSKVYNEYANIFTKIEWIRSGDSTLKRLGLMLGYAWALEKKLKRIVEEIKPDIIHAHNIFVAQYAHKLGISMVFDDHELYSVVILTKFEKTPTAQTKLRKAAANTLSLSKRWKRWEHELGYNHPVITVSNGIAEYYKKISNHVFIVPNYPSNNAIKSYTNINNSTENDVCSVYVGMDSPSRYRTYRDIIGLHDIFYKPNTGKLLRIGVNEPNTERIRSLGYIPMSKVFEIMHNEGHIGLVPWKRHWYHRYCAVNKAYEYAYCGLWLIVTDTMLPIINDFGSICDTFSTYEELESLLVYYNKHVDELDHKRLEILNYANNNLIWEKTEHKIVEAYKVA